MNERRKQSFLCGRSLLKYALVQEKLLNSADCLPNVSYQELGKPYLELVEPFGSAMHFNLSHSHDLMGLAIGTYAQGIDIELVAPQRLKKRLIERVLNQAELKVFNDLEVQGVEEQARFFTQQWTIRESLIKVLGKSIFAMDSLNIDPQEQCIKAQGYPKGVIACFSLALAAREHAAPCEYIMSVFIEDSTQSCSSLEGCDDDFINSQVSCYGQEMLLDVLAVPYVPSLGAVSASDEQAFVAIPKVKPFSKVALMPYRLFKVN